MAMRSMTLALLAAPILLTACGDYDVIRVSDVHPYGNKRTAGSNVVYVLAKLLPEKELNLEKKMTPIHREMKPKPISNEKALSDLRAMFAKEQRK